MRNTTKFVSSAVTSLLLSATLAAGVVTPAHAGGKASSTTTTTTTGTTTWQDCWQRFLAATGDLSKKDRRAAWVYNGTCTY